MGNNDLTVSQISTILNNIVNQASGGALATVDTTDFITVAQYGLKTGYDPLLNAISQTLSRTLFSTRPYYAKLINMRVTGERYGNHVRKLNVVDKDFLNDDEWTIQDTNTVDQQRINFPKVIQTNFYGEIAYNKALTLTRNQLNIAFSDSSEFGRFVSMLMTNVSDMIEQAHEACARLTLANLIAGAQKVDLLAEYNKVKGTSLKHEDIFKKDNFTDFFEFAYATMRTYSNKLTERSILYHKNINKGNIHRHTPRELQRMYVLSSYDELVKSTVLSSVFNDNYLRELDFEEVNYWQSLATPANIQGKFTSLETDGTLRVNKDTTYQNIFGIIFDDEAAGYTTVDEWSAPTPFNAVAGYSTINWHFTDRYWNDFTENAIVFTLGDTTVL